MQMSDPCGYVMVRDPNQLRREQGLPVIPTQVSVLESMQQQRRIEIQGDLIQADESLLAG